MYLLESGISITVSDDGSLVSFGVAHSSESRTQIKIYKSYTATLSFICLSELDITGSTRLGYGHFENANKLLVYHDIVFKYIAFLIINEETNSVYGNCFSSMLAIDRNALHTITYEDNKYYVNSINIDYTSGKIVTEQIKEINKETSTALLPIGDDMLFENRSNGEIMLYTFDTDYNLCYLYTIAGLSGDNHTLKKDVFTRLNTGKNAFAIYYTEPDYTKVVALKYDGDYYYKQAGGILTAGQGDVRAGKTFIGWQGYPETGTMGVTE